MTRALVLGGGGHLGAALTRALVGRGADVTVTTRTDGDRANLADVSHRRAIGDDSVAGTLEDWVPGHSLVIDAAAPYALDLHEPGRSHAERLGAAEDRMARLLSACRDAGAILVHIGSIMTMRTDRSAQRRLIEASHPYFKLKHRMQARAVEATRTGQPIVVINPSSLLGPWNLRPFHHCYVSAVMTGGMPASFPDIINVMDVRDAAEAILRVTDAGWFGHPVTLSGHDISVHDLTDQIVEMSGARRPPRWRALAAGAAVLYTAETALGAVGVRSPYPTLPVLLTLASGPTPQSRTQQELGPVLRPLNATIADEIEWHRSRGCP